MRDQDETKERLLGELLALRRAHSDLNQVLNATVPLCVIDRNYALQWCNDSFCSFFHKEEEELLGKECRLICPEDLGNAPECPLEQILQGKQRHEFEVDNTLPDGTRVSYIVSATPYRDPEGNVLGIVSSLTDITERKRLEMRLQQAGKMETIGQLVGGIAHDFNNMLTVINVCSDMLLGRMPPKDPSRRELEEIHKAGQRAASMARHLLAFSRRQMQQQRVLDFNQVLESMADVLQRLIGAHISLELKLAEDLGNVKADAVELERMVMNLAVNARDAMPKGGCLTLGTANVEVDEVFTAGRLEIEPGRYVALPVSDTGRGMTPEVQERIFEPFFTTKESGEGTGLGLSTVYGIVKRSGGDIEVYSKLGRGTTFRIYLPCVDEKLEAREEPELSPSPKGTETILVVEDQEEVRRLAVDVLRRQGYTVLEAADGAEALELARTTSVIIDLFLTDLIMPAMSGQDFIERLSQVRQDFAVLYMSGYANGGLNRQTPLVPEAHLMQKPFTANQLALRVRQALDEKKSLGS